MRYAVDYCDDAHDKLAACWMAAADPNAVTVAQNQIDRLLSRDPRKFGFELSEDLWCIEEPPLAAYYEIHRLR